MSKESALALECPGCTNKVYYVEFHKCPDSTGLLAEQRSQKKKVVEDSTKRRKRRKKSPIPEEGNDE